MILGGIPYYLNSFNQSLSLAQNIDTLFFIRNAKLSNEFERLFNSIFDNADVRMKIVRHVGQIKQALQIAGVSSEEYPFTDKGDDDSHDMQIDPVIDRGDDVLNICEMKYTSAPFIVTKQYAEVIEKRRTAFAQKFPHKSIHMTLVTTFPTSRGIHKELFQSEVTIDDLFSRNARPLDKNPAKKIIRCDGRYPVWFEIASVSCDNSSPRIYPWLTGRDRTYASLPSCSTSSGVKSTAPIRFLMRLDTAGPATCGNSKESSGRCFCTILRPSLASMMSI